MDLTTSTCFLLSSVHRLFQLLENYPLNNTITEIIMETYPPLNNTITEIIMENYPLNNTITAIIFGTHRSLRKSSSLAIFWVCICCHDHVATNRLSVATNLNVATNGVRKNNSLRRTPTSPNQPTTAQTYLYAT